MYIEYSILARFLYRLNAALELTRLDCFHTFIYLH